MEKEEEEVKKVTGEGEALQGLVGGEDGGESFHRLVDD